VIVVTHSLSHLITAIGLLRSDHPPPLIAYRVWPSLRICLLDSKSIPLLKGMALQEALPLLRLLTLDNYIILIHAASECEVHPTLLLLLHYPSYLPRRLQLTVPLRVFICPMMGLPPLAQTPFQVRQALFSMIPIDSTPNTFWLCTTIPLSNRERLAFHSVQGRSSMF
jgi:hypothetical protein